MTSWRTSSPMSMKPQILNSARKQTVHEVRSFTPKLLSLDILIAAGQPCWAYKWPQHWYPTPQGITPTSWVRFVRRSRFSQSILETDHERCHKAQPFHSTRCECFTFGSLQFSLGGNGLLIISRAACALRIFVCNSYHSKWGRRANWVPGYARGLVHWWYPSGSQTLQHQALL